MKKFIKVVGFGFLGLICLGIAVSMISGGGSDSVKTTASPKQEAKQEPKKAADPINQENYEKITQGDSLTGEGGMTIEEVKAILGEPDSEMESQSGDMKMKDLTWTNLKFESISVTFTNGKVSFKTYLK